MKRKKFCMVWDVYPKSSTDMDIPTVNVYEGHIFRGTSLSFLLDTGFSEGHGLTGRVHLSSGLSPATIRSLPSPWPEPRPSSFACDIRVNEGWSVRNLLLAEELPFFPWNALPHRCTSTKWAHTPPPQGCLRRRHFHLPFDVMGVIREAWSKGQDLWMEHKTQLAKHSEKMGGFPSLAQKERNRTNALNTLNMQRGRFRGRVQHGCCSTSSRKQTTCKADSLAASALTQCRCSETGKTGDDTSHTDNRHSYYAIIHVHLQVISGQAILTFRL